MTAMEVKRTLAALVAMSVNDPKADILILPDTGTSPRAPGTKFDLQDLFPTLLTNFKRVKLPANAR